MLRLTSPRHTSTLPTPAVRCAQRSGRCRTVWRTGQVDPQQKFPFCPMANCLRRQAELRRRWSGFCAHCEADNNLTQPKRVKKDLFSCCLVYTKTYGRVFGFVLSTLIIMYSCLGVVGRLLLSC